MKRLLSVLAVLLVAWQVSACHPKPPAGPVDDQNIRHAQDVESCKRQPELPWCE